MIFKICKIVLISVSFIFLTGFIHITSLIGPSVTIISSGNIFKAGGQFVIDKHIKKKTGKNSLTIVKEEVIKKNRQNDLKQNDINKELKLLLEKRINITRQILANQKDQKNLNYKLRNLIEKKIKITQKKLDFKKINQ